MTPASDAPSFNVETAHGPAVLTFFDRDRALIPAEALTVGRIASAVRFHLKRDHAGRFADDGLYVYRVGDRWTPISRPGPAVSVVPGARGTPTRRG